MFSPSWLTDGHRLSRTPLLSALLNCPAPLRLRSEVLAPLFQSRRAPSTQQGNTHTHRRGRSLPPQAVTHFADRRLGQIRGARILGPALLLAEGGRKSWGESFTPPALALGILLHGVRYFQRSGSEREKQNCLFIDGKARCFICKSWFIWSWLSWDCEKNRAVQSTGGPPVLVDITVYWA